MTISRVRITGKLTLRSPLALCDGRVEGGDAEGDGGVATVMRTADGCAVIPGSSLKGVLREYMRSCGAKPAVIDGLLGRESAEKGAAGRSADSGQGGKVEFGFCYSAPNIGLAEEQSVAIDRITRAAADRQLFARQVVPAGAVFDVELLGFGLGRDELAVLLEALRGFDAGAPQPLQLGAGGANSYGLATWGPGKVQTHDATTIAKWFRAGAVSTDLWNFAQDLDLPTTGSGALTAGPRIRFDLRLDFTGWFLVKDPRKTKRDGKDAGQMPDAFPLLTADNHVLLPARGFRGSLRSQAERIARTFHVQAGGDPNRPGRSRIVESLFGDTDSRSLIKCSPFVDRREAWDGSDGKPLDSAVRSGKKTALLRREFVAVDRFTGGAAEHLKFDAVAAWRPELQGQISLDVREFMHRCVQNKIPPGAAFGLLVRTLRDLAQGDIGFGFGRGKGFGENHGSIVSHDLPDPSRLLGDWHLEAPQSQPGSARQATSGATTPFAGFSVDACELLSRSVKAMQDYFQKGIMVSG